VAPPLPTLLKVEIWQLSLVFVYTGARFGQWQ